MMLTRLAMVTLSWGVILLVATSLSASFTLSMAAYKNKQIKNSLRWPSERTECNLAHLQSDIVPLKRLPEMLPWISGFLDAGDEIPCGLRWCPGSIQEDLYIHCWSPWGSGDLSWARKWANTDTYRTNMNVTGKTKIRLLCNVRN